MTRAFVFQLTPKLEALEVERRASEGALARAQLELKQAGEDLARVHEIIAKIAAQAAERDRSVRDLAGPIGSDELARWDARMVLLARRMREARVRERTLVEREAFARQLVALRARELNLAFERVRTLEKLREVQQREVEIENEKVRQQELDEAAQRAWLDRRQREQ